MTTIELCPADEHIHVSIRCSNGGFPEAAGAYEARQMKRAVAQALYEAFAVFTGHAPRR